MFLLVLMVGIWMGLIGWFANSLYLEDYTPAYAAFFGAVVFMFLLRTRTRHAIPPARSAIVERIKDLLGCIIANVIAGGILYYVIKMVSEQ